jgi:hypothetical protein
MKRDMKLLESVKGELIYGTFSAVSKQCSIMEFYRDVTEDQDQL